VRGSADGDVLSASHATGPSDVPTARHLISDLRHRLRTRNASVHTATQFGYHTVTKKLDSGVESTGVQTVELYGRIAHMMYHAWMRWPLCGMCVSRRVYACRGSEREQRPLSCGFRRVCLPAALNAKTEVVYIAVCALCDRIKKGTCHTRRVTRLESAALILR
jgi:hypothetical protein